MITAQIVAMARKAITIQSRTRMRASFMFVRAVGPPSPRTSAEAERSSPPRTAETSRGTRQFSIADIGFLNVLLLRMRIAAAICR